MYYTKESSKLSSITCAAILGGLLFDHDTAVISGAEKGLEAFFVWRWVPETKGKTLEDMSQLWLSKKNNKTPIGVEVNAHWCFKFKPKMVDNNRFYIISELVCK